MARRSVTTSIEVDASQLPPLGMPADAFLREYWQKKPLLIRNAFPGFVSPIAPEDLAAGELVRAIKASDKNEIVTVRLFDQFTGGGVPDGKKSLAVEVTLQPVAKSYADDDLKAISERIVAAATKIGADLRG